MEPNHLKLCFDSLSDYGEQHKKLSFQKLIYVQKLFLSKIGNVKCVEWFHSLRSI